MPARAKFARFMRSRFESFSLTVKPPEGNDGAEGSNSRGWIEGGGEGERVEGRGAGTRTAEESAEWRGTSY